MQNVTSRNYLISVRSRCYDQFESKIALKTSTKGYYIYAHDACSLRKMLGKVVHKCIAFGVQNVIADLVNEHRMYESEYQELGFKRAAEWARIEINLIRLEKYCN